MKEYKQSIIDAIVAAAESDKIIRLKEIAADLGYNHIARQDVQDILSAVEKALPTYSAIRMMDTPNDSLFQSLAFVEHDIEFDDGSEYDWRRGSLKDVIDDCDARKWVVVDYDGTASGLFAPDDPDDYYVHPAPSTTLSQLLEDGRDDIVEQIRFRGEYPDNVDIEVDVYVGYDENSVFNPAPVVSIYIPERPVSRNPLRALRLERNMTQADLAKKSGVNIRQIRRYESGESDIDNMTLANARAIADALDIHIDELR